MAIPFHSLPQALDELRDLQRRLRQGRASQAQAAQRLAELEHGVGRIALLARALAELGLERGWFTREELEQRLQALDTADGARDERLDPRVALPGESKLADLEPLVQPESKRKRPSSRRRR